MPANALTLQNDALTARFDENGKLIHLARKRCGNLIRDLVLQHVDRPAGKVYTSESDGPARTPSGSFSRVRAYHADAPTTQRSRGADSVLTTWRCADLQVHIQYTLKPKAPLLELQVTIDGRTPPGAVFAPSLPKLILADDFVDTFEDTQDLYFDGAELGDGRELPPWRVFFRQGHRGGLLLATPNRDVMSRFNLNPRGFELWPHTQFNYSTSGIMNLPPLELDGTTPITLRYSIGPWRRSDHEATLKAAGLHKPVAADHPFATGKRPVRRRGHIIHLAEAATAAVASSRYTPDRWLRVSLPWASREGALYANPGVMPPPVPIKPELEGPHHVYVGIGHGCGATLQTDGPESTLFRLAPDTEAQRATTFLPGLAGSHEAHEVDFGVIDLAPGQTLRLGRLPNSHLRAMLDTIRFVRLTPAQARQWRRQQETPPRYPLSGLNDIPDIANLLDARDPDPQTFAANIAAHASAGLRKIYWRIDGQCCDYPSQVNTMRYVSAKTHGVYNPQAKAYGRALLKTDILRLAVDTAKREGVELYGWQRFNNYSGNVQSDFFRNNPRYHDQTEKGTSAAKLCLAHKAVREHKIAILVEAARYGLDGLCLGFLRHPPVHQYAPIMTTAYKRKFGHLPPRDPDHPDPLHRHSLPIRDDPEYTQWWQFRADYVTTFGRELRRALAKAGLANLRIALWVRPNHCLFDGVDIPAWLEEGLCDEIVSGSYNSNEHGWETPAWKAMVQAKVPLIREMHANFEAARRDMQRIEAAAAEGKPYDGICTYESDWTVLETDYLDLYRSLRTAP